MWNSKGESDFYLHKSFFKIVLPLTKPVSCALSQEFHKLTAGDHIPPWPTNTPICFFPSEQLWHLPARLALSLHLHAGTARGRFSYLYWCRCQCHHTASPALLCTALFLTLASPAAALPHLGQATLGTSQNLAR